MAALLFGIGWLITTKNASSYLSTYNTMSPHEKADFDLKGYLKFFKHFHILLGSSLAFFSIVLYLVSTEDALVYLLVFYPILAYIYFIYQTKILFSKKEKKWLNLALAILILTAISIGALLFYGNKTNEFIIHHHDIEITGIYGETIEFSKIKQLNLCDNYPEINLKTNGYALENIKKGYFKTKDGEKVKLILNSLEMPCLLIELHSGQKIYYSENTEANTKLYQDYLKVRNSK